MTRLHSLALCLFLVFLHFQPAIAGMPTIGFSELAGLRLQAISFFLMGLLVSAFAVQHIWNWLQRDFSQLPRLTFIKSCGIVVLWGLLFVIVLTMISGARELMTPGAWEKNGLTYKLREETTAAVEDGDELQLRQQQIEQLGEALMQYARAHDGRFPPSREDAEINPDRWRVPGSVGMRYVYLPSESDRRGDEPLVCEPNIYDGQLFVLSTKGVVTQVSYDELHRRVSQAPQP